MFHVSLTLFLLFFIEFEVNERKLGVCSLELSMTRDFQLTKKGDVELILNGFGHLKNCALKVYLS